MKAIENDKLKEDSIIYGTPGMHTAPFLIEVEDMFYNIERIGKGIKVINPKGRQDEEPNYI